LPALQIALFAIGAVLVFMLVRRALSDLSQAKSGRSEQLRRLDAEAEREAREAKSPHPCPLCGSETRFHRYPHLEVWRCVRFPECRGFIKARKSRRAAFAARWEHGRAGRGRRHTQPDGRGHAGSDF